MTVVNTNSAAIRAHLQASKTNSLIERASTRLSSGLRINSAADDAAGYTVANKLAAQLASIRTSLDNTANGVSLIQSALSGMQTSLNIVQRMRELATQTSNGVYTLADRRNAQEEIKALLGELKRLSQNTRFNGVNLLDGSFDNYMRVGNANSETIDVKIDGMGINKNIEGEAYASGSSIQILSPEEFATGASQFDTLRFSTMQGSSTPTFLPQSAASGTSQFNTLVSSTASGSSRYDVLSTNSATGTSSFNTPLTSAASGSDTLDYLAATTAVGSSSFLTPATSSAAGTSVLDISPTQTATGTSSFDHLNQSVASGTSTLDFLTSTTGTGTSQFNTATSSLATGTSSLDVLATNSATTINSGDSTASSVASGSSQRVILTNSTATGSSSFDQLAVSNGTGTSTPSGVLAVSDASVKPGGQSTLVGITFDNYDFSQGAGAGSAGSGGGIVTIPGWEVHLHQVALGPGSGSVTSTIGGFATPTDNSQPAGSPGDDAPLQQWSSTPIRYNYSVGNNAITLGTSDVKSSPYGQVHGPYIISENALSLQAGDSVSFDWQAVGSGDAADVYAYLLNVDDGSTVELFNYTHSAAGATPVFTVSETLTTGGNFKFVFVSGSYDKTGGQKLGSNLTISNINVSQTDPSQSQTTAAEVTLQAYEGNQITINRARLGELDRIVGEDPGTGSFSIRPIGNDFNKFQIDATGNITSTQPLLRQNQASYNFEVLYQTSTGGSHIERITLELLNSQRGQSIITAQEANQVRIDRTDLSLLNSFASADNLRGNFRIVNSGSDYTKFQIDSNGNISTTSAIEFDTKDTYRFEVNYTASDGRQYNNEITLHITDTLSATATLTTEETQNLTINASTLASLATYASKHPGGVYSLGGSDAGNFSIDANGRIISTTALLLAEQARHQFSIYYDVGGTRFTENVTLNLTEALQASSSLSVNESSLVTINRQTLSKLNAYAAADNYAGTYRLESNPTDPGDYLQFSIAADGTVTSRAPIDFSVENRFDFDVVYRDSNGIDYRDSVILNVTDPNYRESSLTAEETDALTITADKFINTAAFASTHAGGGYQLTGTDAGLFTIDANGVVTSNQSLALSTAGTYNRGRTYQFDIVYTSGANTQTERVNLRITEALQATSNLTADESGGVTIEASEMARINSFARRDRFNGSFQITPAGPDHTLFTIDQEGTVRSTGALDFTTKPSYSFDITYTASDNRVFTETVNLGLNDTLSSTATIETEETLALTIPAATLASTATYAGLNAGGGYSITGTDAAYFTVDNTGAVTSTQSLLRSNKTSYQFNLIYAVSGGSTHSEAVTVNLTEALQGTSNFNADESDEVKIMIDDLINLSGFGSRDGSRGNYSIVASGPDYTNFHFDADGNIVSVGPLDFSNQQAYSFDVVYTGSDGRQYTETINLTLNDTLTSAASLSAEETQSLTITAATLTSTATYASRNAGGAYSLVGADAGKFSIDANGNITSTQNLLRAVQSRYVFDVIYDAGPGKQHTESVTLDLTEALNGITTVSAHESGQITISNSTFDKIYQFAQRDGFNGSFAIATTGADYNHFQVLSNGTVRTTGPLDFTTQQSYSFDLVYTASDARQFTEAVTLNLTDTLQSSATLSAEETQNLTIAAATLASTATYAGLNGGGSYSLTEADSALFAIDANGAITSRQPLLIANQQSYNFTVVYTASGGRIHSEAVQLNLTEALQSNATLTADESGEISIAATTLQKINGFAGRDGFRGRFSIATTGTDHGLFAISSSGKITSRSGLDFTSQQSYGFDVIYDASDGRRFTTSVTLDLNDTLSSSATLVAEETRALTINAATLTSTATYAGLNAGGTYSLSGADSTKFSIDNTGRITSTSALLLDNQPAYDFTVNYRDTNGATHSETVNLTLDRARQGTSTLTATEAGLVNLPASSMSIINGIASADRYRGSFSILPTGTDHQLFSIAQDGTITSNGPLDYSTQQTYSFDVVYRQSNGETYTDTVNLTIDDTLTSTAVMHAEEADIVTLAASDFTSTEEFARQDGFAGSYSLAGPDSRNFRIDANGNITSTLAMRRANKAAHNFTIVYTGSDNRQHRENVTLHLDRFLQAHSNVEAVEGQTVILNSASLTHLNDFARDDNHRGTYRFGTSRTDYQQFTITSNGRITSRTGLDYDTQNQFDFDIIYTASDGREFTDNVHLDLTDTLTASASITVEESDRVVIDSVNLTSLLTYAAKDGNGGTFSIAADSPDGALFDIQPDGSLVSKDILRLSEHPVMHVNVRYNAVNLPDFTEQLTIGLTPTTYDTTRSILTSTEAEEVIVIPNLNPYLRAYAAADNYAGRFEISSIPGNPSIDFQNFEIDDTGQVTSKNPMDFESGKTQFDFRILYRHSTNGNTFTDYTHLNIINDKRDDNNLALEEIDISSAEGAVNAVSLLDEAILRISSAQARLGALENRMHHNLDNLSMNALLSETARGRITDADYAEETSAIARAQILQNAATAMLANATQAQKQILMLLE